jgi:flagellar hook-basal body complex protein FliE
MSDGMQIQSIGVGAAARASLISPASAAAASEGTTSFKDVLFARIEQVNTLQREAEAAVAELSSGRARNVDEVLSAVRKADLAFQTHTEIRNKLMEAYQEIQQLRI